MPNLEWLRFIQKGLAVAVANTTSAAASHYSDTAAAARQLVGKSVIGLTVPAKNIIMFWRNIYCQENDASLDQDIYDAAVWSAVTPQSETFVNNRTISAGVADFIWGLLKIAKPIGSCLRIVPKAIG